MRRYKNTVLFSLLALTLGAVVWVSDGSENTVENTPMKVVAEKARQERNHSNNQSTLQLNKLQRDSISMPISVASVTAEGNNPNPFSAKSWYSAPPPVPAASLPPVAPTAPPLPFIYAGKLQEEGGELVFYLTHGEQFFAVKQGETFDNVYQLEGVANGKLTIFYLPLKIKQFLPITPEF